MSDAIEHYRQIAATQRVVSGNRPQLLDDPGVVWIVESGTIAIFAVPLVDGKISGRRQYLFEVESGAALFGWREGDRGLLAVAIEPATVLQIPAKAFDDLLDRGSPEAIASFETWTQGAIAAVDEVDRDIDLPQPSLAALDPFHERIRQALDRLERHQRDRGDFCPGDGGFRRDRPPPIGRVAAGRRRYPQFNGAIDRGGVQTTGRRCRRTRFCCLGAPLRSTDAPQRPQATTRRWSRDRQHDFTRDRLCPLFCRRQPIARQRLLHRRDFCRS